MTFLFAKINCFEINMFEQILVFICMHLVSSNKTGYHINMFYCVCSVIGENYESQESDQLYRNWIKYGSIGSPAL